MTISLLVTDAASDSEAGFVQMVYAVKEALKSIRPKSLQVVGHRQHIKCQALNALPDESEAELLAKLKRDPPKDLILSFSDMQRVIRAMTMLEGVAGMLGCVENNIATDHFPESEIRECAAKFRAFYDRIDTEESANRNQTLIGKWWEGLPGYD